MQLIYRASDITEAHIVSGMLQAHGLEAFVGGHYLQGAIGDMAVQDFAVVHVADEDVAEAKRLIADYEEQAGGDTDSYGSSIVRRADRVGSSPLTRLITGIVVVVVVVVSFYLFGS
ncbi:DUF2007 domain-containing protein [Halopseudomonas nanhaiensis]|uniref:putative signal transducing protein n=1 Tax=Halopseudomonas nanhaiensis TaxID=2830842 RepID=UPI001CBFE716|nr:DUF2007 domain-containing protein [Halopseudomonas nanhaiensis]UAW98353.1 DUF2007 domain-containing protein [Halopseudomonas nanhaiensis]